MASMYFTRTPSSAGNRKTWTLSVWCKFSSDTGEMPILNAWSSDANSGHFVFKRRSTNSSLGWSQWALDNYVSQTSRDINAWYHIVLRVDTTQSTASDRARLYINGEQVTSFATSYNLGSNEDTEINNSSIHHIGVQKWSSLGSNYFNGSMAHYHLCDGTSYAPTAFAETDSTTGIWKPKTAPSVNYGTNGFFLKFDNSANMGLDSSGQGNNWTTNGTIIQNKDTPTNVFATLNPLTRPTSSGNNTFSNVNSEMTNSADAFRTTFATLGASKGKYYWEAKFLSGEMKQMIGVSKPQETMDFVGQSSGSWGWQNENARRYNNNSYTSYGSTASSGDIMMVAFDATNGAIWVGKNGSWFNSATQSEIEAGTVTNAMFSSITIDDYFLPAFTTEDSNIQVNFGNGYFGTTAVSSAQNPSDGIGIFEYSVPSGYKALCTKSINAQEYS